MTTTSYHTEQSRPASSVEIAEALKVLFNSLPFQRGTDPETAVIAYTEALRGASVEGIRAGISKFLRGECEGVSSKFIPTPPELARIVRTTAVPQRVPQIGYQRRDEKGMDARAKARMRLKMPMLAHAWGNETLMRELDQANKSGLEDMIALAMKWGLGVPAELYDQTNAEWRTARARALNEIERNPSEGIARQSQARSRFAGRPVIAENVSLHEFRRLSASRQLPVGAVWCAALATIFGPEPSARQEAA